MSNPWSQAINNVSCSLKDVMSEQLAVELQQEEVDSANNILNEKYDLESI